MCRLLDDGDIVFLEAAFTNVSIKDTLKEHEFNCERDNVSITIHVTKGRDIPEKVYIEFPDNLNKGGSDELNT